MDDVSRSEKRSRRLSQASRTSRISQSTLLSQSTVNFPYYGDRSILVREAENRQAEHQRQLETRLAERQMEAAYRQSNTYEWTSEQARSPEPALKLTGTTEDIEQDSSESDDTPPGPPKALLLKQLTAALFMLIILFWGNAAWIMGKVYKQSDYAWRLHILAVDLDGGDIGKALLESAESMSKSHGIPTIDIIDFTTDLTASDISRRVLDGTKIWGAMVANAGASSNLSAAFTSSDATYDPTTAISLMYNGVRYHTAEQGVVIPAMMAVFEATMANYQENHGADNIRRVSNSTNPKVAAKAVLQPINFTELELEYFAFGSNILINSVMFVFPVLSQFFGVMFINGILGLSGAYQGWSIKTNLIIRAVVGLVFPCVFALSWGGWLFIFDTTANFSAKQYFLAWLTVWLYAGINFQIVDAFLCVFEMKWAPFMVLSLAITAVSSVFGPHELANHFYRIDYFFPAYHIWGLHMTNFGNGANKNLGLNVTVPIIWWLLVVALAFWLNIRQFTRLKTGGGDKRLEH